MSSKLLLYFFLISFVFTPIFTADDDEDLIDLDAKNRPKPDDEDVFYVPIFLTNDIHGKYYWTNATSGDVSYKSGGLDYLARYLTILRKEFGEERVLYFDSGDEFTGFMGKTEGDSTKGEVITEFFNAMKCDGATLGNHDYDFSKKQIGKILENSEFPYLMANIYNNEEETSKVWKNQEPYKIFEIPTGDEKKEAVRIGVIGLANVMSSIPSTLGDVKFYDYAETAIEYADILKDEGVDAIVLLVHGGLSCSNQAMTYGIYTKEDSTPKKGDCQREMYDMLKKIPEGTIDAVLAGHSHMENHCWVNGVPIVSGTNMGSVSNVLYLAFNKNKKYKLLPDEVKMEGPLPTCEKIFSKSKNCATASKFGGGSSNGVSGDLVDFTYHGKKMKKEKLLEEISAKYAEYQK